VTLEGGVVLPLLSRGAAVCAPARGASRIAKRAKAGVKPAVGICPAGVAFRAQ